MKILRLFFPLCLCLVSSCTSVSDSSGRLCFVPCELPSKKALRLKDEANVTVYRTADGEIAYLAWETVCRDEEEVREQLAEFAPPHTKAITVHLSLLCTEYMMLRAIQPLLDAGFSIRYVTAVNSMDAVPFVYALDVQENR